MKEESSKSKSKQKVAMRNLASPLYEIADTFLLASRVPSASLNFSQFPCGNGTSESSGESNYSPISQQKSPTLFPKRTSAVRNNQLIRKSSSSAMKTALLRDRLLRRTQSKKKLKKEQVQKVSLPGESYDIPLPKAAIRPRPPPLLMMKTKYKQEMASKEAPKKLLPSESKDLPIAKNKTPLILPPSPLLLPPIVSQTISYNQPKNYHTQFLNPSNPSQKTNKLLPHKPLQKSQKPLPHTPLQNTQKHLPHKRLQNTQKHLPHKPHKPLQNTKKYKPSQKTNKKRKRKPTKGKQRKKPHSPKRRKKTKKNNETESETYKELEKKRDKNVGKRKKVKGFWNQEHVESLIDTAKGHHKISPREESKTRRELQWIQRQRDMLKNFEKKQI